MFLLRVTDDGRPLFVDDLRLRRGRFNPQDCATHPNGRTRRKALAAQSGAELTGVEEKRLRARRASGCRDLSRLASVVELDVIESHRLLPAWRFREGPLLQFEGDARRARADKRPAFDERDARQSASNVDVEDGALHRDRGDLR